DGSAHSQSAALLAADQAVFRQVSLRMIRALPPVRSIRSWSPSSEDTEAARSHTVTELEGDREWIVHHYPALDVHADVIQGHTVDVLGAETREAQITVLGTTGRGGFTGRLLGSTADGLLHSAEGPLLVAPSIRDARLKSRASFPGADDDHAT